MPGVFLGQVVGNRDTVKVFNDGKVRLWEIETTCRWWGNAASADGFIYVLEGSVVMQVRGGKETILTPGQSFYEGPDDVHVVGRNASQTKPAKFLVFLVKDKGAPVLVPAN